MSKGLSNFLKVFFIALIQPSRLFVLGIGLVLSFIFPNIQIFMIPLAILTAVIMAWADVNDPEFIKKALNPQTGSQNANVNLNSLIELLDIQLKNSIDPEVRNDLIATKEGIAKIHSILNDQSVQNQFTDAEFVKRYVEKVVEKLLRLSRQEQVARGYLKKESKEAIQHDIDALRTGFSQTIDSVAQKEYKKSIQLKEDQLNLLQNVEQRLQRIDSYIARIRIVLEQTYGYLTKASLRDETDVIDESDILTDSLKQIVDDIDTFESKTLEIGEHLVSEDKPLKSKAKQTL